MADSILPSTVKEALGCLFIGLVLASGAYGISVLQAYTYFRDSGRDAGCMRLFVSFLFLIDTVSMALTVSGEWTSFVDEFGNTSLLQNVPTTLVIGNAFTVVIGTLTQCFFAHRLWALSKGNMILVSSIVILAICSFGPGIALSVRFYQDNSIAFFASFEARILSGFTLGLSVVCDVLISVALSYYLYPKRTGFKRADSMINELITYTVNRGVLTAICLGAQMVTTVALPGRFIFVPFSLLSGRLYCNTLLATLNAQKSTSREADTIVELDSQIFYPTNPPIPRRRSSRRSPGRRSESTSGCMPTRSLVVDITVEKITDMSSTPSLDHSDV
ncbi:hypothetical protein V8D89_009423 [Ganoderma adspersum]